MTKGLLLLAFWALVATGLMALAGAWHPQTYTVVHADVTQTEFQRPR